MFTKSKEISIGSLEAEEEISAKSKMDLEDVFYDLIDIDNFFENETKFLLVGGKGTGKSACARVYKRRSKKAYNKFCKIITKSELNFERIIQAFPSSNHKVKKRELKKYLIEWLLLNQLLDLIKQHEYIKTLKEYRKIEEFQIVNRGITSINERELIEAIKQFSGEVNVDPLNGFLKANFGKTQKFKFKKAFFVQVIPDLRNTIKILFEKISDYATEENYFYTLVFDDLDHDLRNTEDHRDFLMDTLRVVKDYNINFLELTKVSLKIVLLIRPDILVELKSYSDSFKLIESYKVNLNWFEGNKDESTWHLRHLVNARISYALKEFDGRQISDDPWYDLIDRKIDNYERTSFKWCLNHTRFRPRDIIYLTNLFLKNLKKDEIVDKIKIVRSFRAYALGLWQEIQNELSFHFEHDDLERIEKIFKKLHYSFTLDEFKNQIEDLDYSFDAEKLLTILFNSSVIGNHESGNYYWKHREDDEPFRVDFSKEFIVNIGLKDNFYDD